MFGCRIRQARKSDSILNLYGSYSPQLAALLRRFEIYFLEIGTDKDHVHFLIQSVPTLAPKSIAQKVKSIPAREVFKRNPEVRQKLWGSSFGFSSRLLTFLPIRRSPVKSSMSVYETTFSPDGKTHQLSM